MKDLLKNNLDFLSKKNEFVYYNKLNVQIINQAFISEIKNKMIYDNKYQL